MNQCSIVAKKKKNSLNSETELNKQKMDKIFITTKKHQRLIQIQIEIKKAYTYTAKKSRAMITSLKENNNEILW